MMKVSLARLGKQNTSTVHELSSQNKDIVKLVKIKTGNETGYSVLCRFERCLSVGVNFWGFFYFCVSWI